MIHPARGIFPLLLSFLLAAGCGPGGFDPEGDGGVGGGDVREIRADPSFDKDVKDTFVRNGCTNDACHGLGASAGLSLEPELAYANLVGVPATQEGFERVTAGKAPESYLVIKLEGRQQVGTRMPPSGWGLDNIDLTNIKNWINQGAKNN